MFLLRGRCYWRSHFVEQVKVCLELRCGGAKSITLKHSLFSLPFFFSRRKHDFFHPWVYMAQVSTIINRIVCVHLSLSFSFFFTFFYFTSIWCLIVRTDLRLCLQAELEWSLVTCVSVHVQLMEFGSMNTSFTS